MKVAPPPPHSFINGTISRKCVIFSSYVNSYDCCVQETAKVIASYGDQIISIKQPDLSEPQVPTKEKKFRGYFKIAR